MRLNLRLTASASVLISSVFARPGHAAQQAVAAGEETGQDFAPDLLLADDHAPDFVVESLDEAGGLVEWQTRWRNYVGGGRLLLNHHA